MAIVPLVACALLAVLTTISLLRIAALALPLRQRFFLALLRMILVAALAAAFFEPVLTFDRLSPTRQPVPVLVDVSQSMRLFSPDESVLPAIKKLEAWNKRHADPGHRFVFYGFGDSLRKLPSYSQVDFSDRRSFLPEPSMEAALRRSTAMLLVSDGNWSNATLPAESFADKNTWFMPLPAIRPVPFLRMEAPAMPPASPAAEPLSPLVTLDGYSAGEQGETLTVAIIENGASIANKAVPVPFGHFHLNVSLPLPMRKAGRHCYRFSAQFPAGKLRCSRYALQTALPGHFTWATTHAAPSLDERFITLALNGDPDFLELAPDSREAADLSVVFDTGRQSAAPAPLASGGVLLFIGSFPGAAGYIPAGPANTFAAQAAEPGKNIGQDLDLARLPPPSRYFLNPRQRLSPSAIYLSATIETRGGAPSDTIPVVFSFAWAGHRALACAAEGIWRWDFMPLALSGAETSLGFSRQLVEWVKDMLTSGLSDKFCIYPAGPLSEIDSLPFRIIFPADLAIPSEVKLACRFTSNLLSFDTSFSVTAAGGAPQSVRLRPLAAGDYRLEAHAACGSRRFSFVDSVFVDQDRSEYTVTEQNISLLREIAQPLTSVSDSSISAAFFSSGSGAGERIKETIPIRRDWVLLLIILGVLGAEWVARRWMRLD